VIVCLYRTVTADAGKVFSPEDSRKKPGFVAAKKRVFNKAPVGTQKAASSKKPIPLLEYVNSRFF
jgi:hypothetical protein